MPDSIGSKDSPFDVGKIIDSVLAESAFFGATRSEQERNRQENFDEICEALKRGTKIGKLHHKMKQKSVIFPCPDIQAIIVGKEPFLKVSGLHVFFAAGKNTNSVK
jgi:hypothetical protein